jgi:2-polyprenyl-3-methyl-5-hydroxy-6-metoxy-1,4-benzoquinol methylase
MNNEAELFCKICGSKNLNQEYPRLRDDENNSVVRCKECDTVQLLYFRNIQEDKDFYDRNKQALWVQPDLDIESIRLKLSHDTERRAEFIQENFVKGSILADIGTGYGFLLNEVRNRGYEIDGYEISDDRRVIAEKLTRQNVYDTNLLQAGKGLERKYDGIFLFQVLEHISQPIRFLEKLYSELKTGGKLVIEVPNYDDWLLNESEEYKAFYYQKAHLYYYNDATIRNILNLCGINHYEYIYFQRYTFLNSSNWILNHRPELTNPSKSLKGYVNVIDSVVKRQLVLDHKSDTMVVVVSK